MKSEGVKNIQYNGPQLLFRGILSGGIIAFAVIMAKVGGPLLGGTFAAFPAVLLSVIIITYLAHGRAFSCETVKALMVGGAINVPTYATVVRYTYPHFGLLYGSLISFAFCLIVTYCV